ncbi:MAG: DMT family transporter, partial [Actinobacteria bacterium]|nr:DMT family transporter [Actinomycetota bacterium]
MRTGPPLRDASPAVRRAVLLGLVGVAAVWGVTFSVVKEAVERIPPVEFLALRFGIAAVLLTAFAWPQVRGLGVSGLGAGALAGLALLAGYSLQTIGLQYTGATNAGFLTGLFVVITPLLSALLLRRLPAPGALVGVVLATAGLGLLSLTSGLGVRYGDALVLGAAASFAVHIVVLGRFSPVHSPAGLTAVQMWVAAALATGWSLAAERVVVPSGGFVWFAVLISAVVSSALGFYVQTLAQRYVSPTRTAVVLASEPAFAGLGGFLLLGETLSPRG